MDNLREFVASRERLVVLTGAGISTASGIPDYRGRDGKWKRRQPMRYQAFVSEQSRRQRYWARSFVGWPQIAAAQPNAAHRALALLQHQGRISRLITQNVDGLHAAAGVDSINLHGDLARVRCLDCGAISPRSLLQQRLQRLNPHWQAGHEERVAPDGDADLNAAEYGDFRIACCSECDGLLKPDVVFFGEMVPPERVAACMQAVLDADGLLVVGSSLMVFSGFRFVRAAHQAGIPVAAINQGRTRADEMLTLKIEADVGGCLQQLVTQLDRGMTAVETLSS